MEKQKHGGQAFPNSRQVGDVQITDGGMTLRDYFAAKAMQAIIIGNNADISVIGIGAMKDAYNVADNMLLVRNKEQNKC